MKILVAIPAYDRTIHVETARSLLNEQAAALAVGDELSTVFAPGCSLITYARNHLVREFLRSDADRLVFVDADVAWEAGAVLKIAHKPYDMVGGAYRYKDDHEGYPVTWKDPGSPLWSNEHGLLEVDCLPGGFLSVSRAVFERLRAHFPGREYTHGNESFYAYFHAPFRDGRLYGEDASFCTEWREAGGRVWLDPELTLTHMEGGKAYKGHVGEWLRSQIVPEVNLDAALAIGGWMSREELGWLALQARRHRRIVEVGSYLGRSTRALADHTAGMVWAVDDWYGPRDAEIADREQLFAQFSANLKDVIGRKVIPCRVDHGAIRSLPLVSPDMVFIDGGHDCESVLRDCAHWMAQLVPGGLLCGHDYNVDSVKGVVDKLFPTAKTIPGTSIWFHFKEEK